MRMGRAAEHLSDEFCLSLGLLWTRKRSTCTSSSTSLASPLRRRSSSSPLANRESFTRDNLAEFKWCVFFIQEPNLLCDLSHRSTFRPPQETVRPPRVGDGACGRARVQGSGLRLEDGKNPRAEDVLLVHGRERDRHAVLRVRGCCRQVLRGPDALTKFGRRMEYLEGRIFTDVRMPEIETKEERTAW